MKTKLMIFGFFFLIIQPSLGRTSSIISYQESVSEKEVLSAGLRIKEDAVSVKSNGVKSLKILNRAETTFLLKITRSGFYQFPDGNDFVEFRLNRTPKSIVFVNEVESLPLKVNLLSVDVPKKIIQLKSRDGMIWVLFVQNGIVKQVKINNKTYFLKRTKINPRRAFENAIMPDVMQKVREHEKAVNRLNEEFIEKLNQAK